MSSDKPKPYKKKQTDDSRTQMIVAIIVAFVIGIAIANMFDGDSSTAEVDGSGELTAAEKRNQAESEDVLQELEKVLLVEESNPTVVRIDDPVPLREKDPDFYKNASAGDYLIVYPSRGVIFRSQEGRIINMAPVINTSNFETE